MYSTEEGIEHARALFREPRRASFPSPSACATFFTKPRFYQSARYCRNMTTSPKWSVLFVTVSTYHRHCTMYVDVNVKLLYVIFTSLLLGLLQLLVGSLCLISSIRILCVDQLKFSISLRINVLIRVSMMWLWDRFDDLSDLIYQ